MNWDVDYNWFEERIWPGLAARVPVFETIKVINAWVGHYDYNALDQNAVIGASSRNHQLLFRQWFSGHGLQQGPAAGNALAELITHGSYRAIDLTRLGYARIATANRFSKRTSSDASVLCISSSVAYGAVGLAATVPALQAAGLTCLQIPTIILSNHPGLGKPAGVRLPGAEIAAMLTALDQRNVLAACEARVDRLFCQRRSG